MFFVPVRRPPPARPASAPAVYIGSPYITSEPLLDFFHFFAGLMALTCRLSDKIFKGKI